MDAFVIAMLQRLDHRKTGCKKSTCEIRLCNKLMLQEAVEAHSLLTLEERCTAAIRKLKSIIQTPDLPFNTMLACKIGSERVCDACFAAYYCVTLRMLAELKADAKAGKSVHGNGPRRFRGNQYRTPESMSDATDKLHDYFIKIKEDESMPVPFVIRRNTETNSFVLPLNYTAAIFYKAYCDFCAENVESPVNVLKFMDVWHADHDDILLAEDKTAYCERCFEFQNAIYDGKITTNDPAYILHNKEAVDLRNYYNAHRKKASGGQCSMYCFDAGEPMRLPRTKQQPSNVYFKSGLKMPIKGVASVQQNRGVLFVYNESQTIKPDGNGDSDADSVLSTVFHVVDADVDRRRHIILQADNCVGQNKNQFTIKFAVFLIARGLCAEVTISFMLVGHTKFIVDGHIGSLKNKIRSSIVYDETDAQQLMNDDSNKHHASSSTPGRIRLVATGAPIWRDWRKFLQLHLGDKTIKDITKYQIFSVRQNNNECVVTGKRLPTDKERRLAGFRIGDRQLASLQNELPSVLPQAGVTDARRAALEDYAKSYKFTKFETTVVPGLPRCQQQ